MAEIVRRTQINKQSRWWHWLDSWRFYLAGRADTNRIRQEMRDPHAVARQRFGEVVREKEQLADMASTLQTDLSDIRALAADTLRLGTRAKRQDLETTIARIRDGEW